MAGQYLIETYAEVLCAAVEAYDYPAVIYDFDSKKEINYCKSDPIHKSEKHREHMSKVERKVHSQLCHEEIKVVKDGLSNVLYWGYATQKGRQSVYAPKSGRKGAGRVGIFRRDVRYQHLSRFKNMAHQMNGTGLVSIRGRANNKEDNIPELTQMPFVSKIRMFLDPCNYPVLDSQIAKFANSECFPTLQNLTIYRKNQTGERIDVTQHNEEVYENWASWCRETASRVNSHPNSPCKDIRAVDVERAIYQLAKSDMAEAWRLLQGPKTDS